MTTSTLYQAPIALTGSVLGFLRRILAWSLSLFFNNPLQNVAIGLLGFALTMSFANALFWQSGVHPAPMFSLQQQAAAVSANNSSIQNMVAPKPREPISYRPGTTGSVQPLSQPIPAPVSPVQPLVIDKVTNEILARAQAALLEMGLFSGKVDGYYGPLTADAIRAFERQQGLPVRGAMSPEVIGQIIAFGDGQVVAGQPAGQSPAQQNSPAGIPAAGVRADDARPHVDERDQAVPDLLRDIATSVAASGPGDAAATSAPAQEVARPFNELQADVEMIRKIQRGLSSLGFYYGPIDGVLGDSMARAIREFENFKSFDMTGRITPQLLVWLEEAGAIT